MRSARSAQKMLQRSWEPLRSVRFAIVMRQGRYPRSAVYMDGGDAHHDLQNVSVTDVAGVCSIGSIARQGATRRRDCIYSGCPIEEPAQEEGPLHQVHPEREAQGRAIVAAVLVWQTSQQAGRRCEFVTDASTEETSFSSSRVPGHPKPECHGCRTKTSAMCTSARLVCDDSRHDRRSSRPAIEFSHCDGEQTRRFGQQTSVSGIGSDGAAERRIVPRWQPHAESRRARRSPRDFPISRTAASGKEDGSMKSHAPRPVATDGEAANPGPRLRRRGPRSAAAQKQRRERRVSRSTVQPNLP